MLVLLWHASVGIRRYLRAYMPSNILLDHLRTPRGLRWAIPVALFLVPAYVFAASVAMTLVADGGSGWLNLGVLVWLWNAMKLAWMAVISPTMLLRRWVTTTSA
jgi:hypothetical protein